MRRLFSSDSGLSTRGSPSPRVERPSLISSFRSASASHSSCSRSIVSPLASALARKMALIPPADVPERMSTVKRARTGAASPARVPFVRSESTSRARRRYTRSMGESSASEKRSDSGVSPGAVARTRRRSSCATPLM